MRLYMRSPNKCIFPVGFGEGSHTCYRNTDILKHCHMDPVGHKYRKNVIWWKDSIEKMVYCICSTANFSPPDKQIAIKYRL